MLAAIKMDNLCQVSNAKGASAKWSVHPEAWVLAVLYIGTFGSFIGYSLRIRPGAAGAVPRRVPQPGQGRGPDLPGPLLGSLIRPIGGKLADRYTGSLVTFWNFLAMGVGTAVVLIAALQHSLPLFVTGFILLFVSPGWATDPPTR